MLDHINENPQDFTGFAEGEGDLDLHVFTSLIQNTVPDMGHEEIKALFTSMDASNDNLIQSRELFSEPTMSILVNRKGKECAHALEGSYHCLPCPPFHPDPKQLEAIKILMKVFDEAVAAQGTPIPPKQSPPKPPPVPADSGKGALGNMFGSLFGGARKKTGVGQTKPKQQTTPKEFIPTPCAPKGAYLYGGCGCGKTVLIDLFFRSLPEGVDARRLHWHEFIRDAFRAMQNQVPGENIFVAMADSLAKKFRILLLDELLITHISEAILVKNLFRHLWSRGVTIITTSNYKPHELYAAGFNREQFVEFFPELEAQCPVIDMTGDRDYRQMDLKEDDAVFFSPLSAEATSAFENKFNTLVGSTKETDANLLIPEEKRNIRVPMAGIDHRGAHVARFSFKDLCMKNLGRADYTALAEKYHTIFIDGVPKFKPDLGAEFTRFVSLTDILYGKKVVLHMQSEVPAQNLFSDALMSMDLQYDVMWAFRRCSSMLAEMQSPKYVHIVWLVRNHMLQETALRL